MRSCILISTVLMVLLAGTAALARAGAGPTKLLIVLSSRKLVGSGSFPILVYDRLTRALDHVELRENPSAPGQFSGNYWLVGLHGLLRRRVAILPYSDFARRSFWFTQPVRTTGSVVRVDLDPRLPPVPSSPTDPRRELPYSDPIVASLIKREKLEEAEFLLRNRIWFEPHDPSAHHHLGIVHFQRRHYRFAIDALRKSLDSPVYRDNAYYYIGLCAVANADRELAQDSFERAVQGRNEKTKPTAHYYLGLSALERHQVDTAIRHFEFVRDRGATPEMRASAQQTLYGIEREKAYQQRLEKSFSGRLGLDFLGYDTNVVGLPNSENYDSRHGGFTFGAGGNLSYQAFTDSVWELSPNYGINLTYHPASEFVNYDYWIHSLTAPLMYKFEVGERAARLTIMPGVTSTWAEVNGVRRLPPAHELLRSYFTTLRGSYALDDNRLFDNGLTVRYDQNHSITATPEDEASGIGLNIATNYVHYRNELRSESYSYGANLDWNPTQGDNFKQLKLTLTGSYTLPVWFDFLFTTSLSGYFGYYYRESLGRLDEQVKLDLLFTRPLFATVDFTQSLSVSNNFSNQVARRYFRYLMTSSLALSF